MRKIVRICGVAIDRVTEAQAVERVATFLRARSADKFLLTTPNPEMLVAADSDAEFKKILNSSQLATADGIGILWAVHFLSLEKRNFWNFLGSLFAIVFSPKKIREPLPARVTGTDLFPQILRVAAENRKKVFLLGAAEGVAAELKTKFEKEIPQLEISGTFAGSPAASAENSIREKIDASGAEILFVAFGAPRQEKWLTRNLPKLKNVRLAAGIGGAFDFHAGRIARAPKFFRAVGCEWLWRLLRQPSRIGRIWTATWRFCRLVWRNR